MATFNREHVPTDIQTFEALAVWCFEELQRLTTGRAVPLGPLGSPLPVFRCEIVEADDGRPYALLEGFPPVSWEEINAGNQKTWCAALSVVGPRVPPEDNGNDSGGGGGEEEPPVWWEPGLWSRFAILLHFDGPEGSTSIVDSGPNGLQAVALGGAALSTTGPVFGTSCLRLPGGGSYVSIPASPATAIGSTNFGIYFRLFLEEGNGDTGVFTTGNSVDALAISISQGQFWLHAPRSQFVALGPVMEGVWLEFAIERIFPSTIVYLNGVPFGPVVAINQWPVNQPHFHIGYHMDPNSSMRGRIDEFSLVVGLPVWRRPYEQTGQPFPDA